MLLLFISDVDDIRENIIDYEEEGGGEGDMTGFNLDVLRCTNMYDADTKIPNGHYIKGNNNTSFNLDVLRCTNMYDADTKIPNAASV